MNDSLHIILNKMVYLYIISKYNIFPYLLILIFFLTLCNAHFWPSNQILSFTPKHVRLQKWNGLFHTDFKVQWNSMHETLLFCCLILLFSFHFMTFNLRSSPILALPPQRFINTPRLWKASSASDTVKYDITIENSKENFSCSEDTF